MGIDGTLPPLPQPDQRHFSAVTGVPIERWMLQLYSEHESNNAGKAACCVTIGLYRVRVLGSDVVNDVFQE